jgi:diguanylate cyclase (GGDEF)-like protein
LKHDSRHDSDSRYDSDETTVDLDSVEASQTTHYDPVLAEIAAFRPTPGVEANIILIAHPEEQMLGRRYRLPAHGKLEIGRSSTADISMPHVHSLSRSHARLNHFGDVVEIEDLGSTNGTYVNDQPIDGRRALKSGDRFQLGAAHFKFLHEEDPEHAYHEAIYQLVMCDGLTQIYNRRKFDEELRREFGRARRHGRPLSLIHFDIDHFKQINDSYGHLCGDAVLQKIARRVTKRLRPEQVFARAGGEEFVILSPEMELAGAEELAEKLCRRIAEEVFRYAELEVEVTCSFGVAALGAGMKRPRELYAAADRAMYVAKREGRNRVSRAAPAE